MGPRSRERGDTSTVRKAITRDIASMGPRSRERGDLLMRWLGLRNEEVASMGPRSRERGDIESAFNLMHNRAGFNGAALT